MIRGDPYLIVPFFQGYKMNLFLSFFEKNIIINMYIKYSTRNKLIPSKFKYLFSKKIGKLMIMGDPYLIVPLFSRVPKKTFSSFLVEFPIFRYIKKTTLSFLYFLCENSPPFYIFKIRYTRFKFDTL